MKIKRFSQKTYLIGFGFAMLVNICLLAFLMSNVLAQISDEKLKNQPIITEVANQDNNPLRITVVNVDNSNPEYQQVNFTVQNIGSKSIRGYVIEGGNKNTGKIITNFFPTRLFQSTASFTEELLVERENVKSNKTLSLSVDYVEFEDGSFWGKDTYGQSENIAGAVTGVETTVEQLKKLVEKGDASTLTTLLKNDLAQIEVSLPETFRNKSEKWKAGFRSGYKSIISFLKNHRNEADSVLLEKLEEVSKNLRAERRREK